MTSYMRRPYREASSVRAWSLNQVCSSSSTVAHARLWSGVSMNPSSETLRL
jgi:hypothetical protein